MTKRKAQALRIDLGWLLSWFLQNFIRDKLKQYGDDIDAALPITFYFNTRYVSGRIIVDDATFLEF
mgnify:CR=1 FL=1